MRVFKSPFLLSLMFCFLSLAPLPTLADASVDSHAEVRVLLTPEHFDADKAIAAIEASDLSVRSKISGKAMVDSARTIPPHQLETALEQIRVVLGLE